MQPEIDQRRRRLVLLVGAIVLLLIGLVIGRFSAPDRQSTSPDSVEAVTPADSSLDNSEEGAIEAATDLAKVMASPTGDASAYIDAMSALAAPDWQERARELAENTLDFVNDRYGSTGRVELIPVRYRLRSYSTGEATVDIWGVVVGSGPKLDGIEESWITGTINLEWIAGEWKVSGQTSKGGPTPELLQTDEDSSANVILDEFSEYSDAPNP